MSLLLPEPTYTFSVVRARPEHLKAVHDIQALAYPELALFRESPEVLQSKLEAYPAGIFIVLVKPSVATDDAITDPGPVELPGGHEGDNVAAYETAPVVTIPAYSNMREDDVVQVNWGGVDNAPATTPIVTDDRITVPGPAELPEGHEGDNVVASATTPVLTIPTYSNMRAGDVVQVHWDGVDNAPPTTPVNTDGSITLAIPWEIIRDTDRGDPMPVYYTMHRKVNLGPRKEAVMGEPVGYLFSHPYSHESVSLHRFPKAKEATEESLLDHDQLMEKYVIHDCAVHPDWRGKGLASKLLKAMEESLLPGGDSSKGAPNLKEIVLVSAQGSRPFWEHNGYQVVADHDVDLSVYGDSAFLMTRSFTF
jgi:GNAT superfamily N-acetyltransferase